MPFSGFYSVFRIFPGFPCSPLFPALLLCRFYPVPVFQRVLGFSGFCLSPLAFQSSVFKAEHCQIVELFGVLDEIIDICHDFFESLFRAEAAVLI